MTVHCMIEVTYENERNETTTIRADEANISP